MPFGAGAPEGLQQAGEVFGQALVLPQVLLARGQLAQQPGAAALGLAIPARPAAGGAAQQGHQVAAGRVEGGILLFVAHGVGSVMVLPWGCQLSSGKSSEAGSGERVAAGTAWWALSSAAGK